MLGKSQFDISKCYIHVYIILNFNFQDPKYAVECPLGTILRVEKVGGSTSRGENAYGLEIFCKVLNDLSVWFLY